ncbi:hypothetical protein STEG23_036441 [Scotinomys teguina]
MSSEFLSELHWEDGFAIPVANQENKTLEDQLSKLQKEKSNLQDQLRDYEDRINSMTSHLKNVNQEFLFTQSLCKARENEIESEEHFKAIAERELGRVKDEIQKLEKEMETIRERKSDKEALTLQLERLTLECNEKRKLLDRELTETLSAQLELDKAAQDFRKIHLERQELIQQWESTIEQMQRHDREIDNCALLDTLKATLNRTSSDLDAVRKNISQIKKDIHDEASKLQKLKRHNEVVKLKLKMITEKTISVEEKATNMEDMLKEEEKAVKEVEVQLNIVKDVLFKKVQELQNEKTKEKALVSEIEGTKSSLKHLNQRLHKLDFETLKQQEIMYSQDFYIQQVERRMSRLKGEINSEEKQTLETKILELKKTLDEKKSTLALLEAQIKKLHNDLYFMKKSNSKDSDEKQSLVNKISELHLFVDRSEKELNKARAVKQDLMIEDNLLKLEVKRTREMLYSKAEEVLSLEKRKQQLYTAMEERAEEIKAHKAMLASQIRYADQQRQTVSSEFHERLSKIDKLKNRYEILIVVMLPPEGEEEKSHAYYVIKAAQEKEELQREGDSLDAKINKAEKEIYALQNTLQVLNSCNSNYKQSFKKVTPSSDEYGLKIQLEEQKRATEEKYRLKQRQIRELQEDIQSMENTFQVIEHLANNAKEKLSEKQTYSLQLRKETEEQQPKIDRVTKQCDRLTREIRILKETNDETLEEQDIQLREIKQFHKDIDQMLVNVMENASEVHVILQTYFEQNGLELPTVKGRSSRSSLQLSASNFTMKTKDSKTLAAVNTAATCILTSKLF